MAGTAVVTFRGQPDDAMVLAALRQVLGDDTESEGRIILTVQRKPKPLGYGPGTELKKFLRRWLGIVATPDCPCNRHAEEMDRNEARQPGWCEANIDTIVGWLRNEAARRKLTFVDAAGRLVVTRAIASARRTPRPPTSAAPQTRTKN
jgi:hypothetical protein